MVDLESLDPFSLPSIPLSDRASLPRISCVYSVLSCESVQYIGISEDLKNRWLNHHLINKLNPETRISWLEINNRDLLYETEFALIKRFSPPLNRQNGVVNYRGKSEADLDKPVFVLLPIVIQGMGEKIWEARKLSGRTQLELCKEAGITRQYWNQIENGQRASIPLHTLRSIERVLHVDFGIEG
jgi:DNA-binding XRE family transcriptional regulator